MCASVYLWVASTRARGRVFHSRTRDWKTRDGVRYRRVTTVERCDDGVQWNGGRASGGRCVLPPPHNARGGTIARVHHAPLSIVSAKALICVWIILARCNLVSDRGTLSSFDVYYDTCGLLYGNILYYIV